MSDDFLYRELPRLGKRVFRLGLAASYGLDEAGARAALERGLNYVFWTASTRKLTRALKSVLPRDRDKLVITAGPTFGYFRGAVRRAAEKALRLLGTDYIDVFQLFWLGKMSAWSEGTVEELVALREEGKVRAIGVSIHDRPRAGKLAKDSPLDLLMIRYNAAHPGAEQDIFPHVADRQPMVVAYTATSWRKLLRRPRGWKGRVATAGDCYRFCLSNEHVDVVLCAPGTVERLDQNLAAVRRGPLSDEDMAFMRELGRAVHG